MSPLILTLRLDPESERFFNGQRKQYFPAERNVLAAHLTLFHQLPNKLATFDYFETLNFQRFSLAVTGLLKFGEGVAYELKSPELLILHERIAAHFSAELIRQDRQTFRPHITVMNKSTARSSDQLFHSLGQVFQPFDAEGLGIMLWRYLGGPWEFLKSVDFH